MLLLDETPSYGKVMDVTTGSKPQGGSSARAWVVSFLVLALSFTLSFAAVRSTAVDPPEAGSCVPTERYNMAESYRPGAPFRESVADGSVLYEGTVRVWPSCLPVPGVVVDAWFVDENSYYTNETRLQVRTDATGRWYYRSGPLGMEVQPHHVHLKVYGPGVRPMTTAVYPDTATSGGRYDLVVLEANGTGPAGFLETEPSSGESKEEVAAKKEGA